MTLQATDGFDAYNSTGANEGLRTVWTQGGAFFTNVSMQAGRFGGQCLRIGANGSSNAASAYRALPANVGPSFGVGFAYKCSNIGTISTTVLNNVFASLASLAGTTQVGLALQDNGQVHAYRLTGLNAGTLLGSSAAGVIAAATWHFIELAVLFSDTVGTLVVKVDGATVINLSGIDTMNSATVGAGRLYFQGMNVADSDNASLNEWDDLYITDGATLGDRRVETIRPNADTADKDFTRSTGSDNYALVDESTVDSTDYVQGSTVGDLDLYDLGALSSTPTTIDAVTVISFAQKTDAASRSIAHVLDLSGTQSTGADKALPASLGKQETIFATKPGGGAWDATAVNALKAGPKVTV